MQKKKGAYGTFSFIQYALMLALLFVVVIFACDGFRASAVSRSLNYDGRSCLSYVVNRIKSFDSEMAVETDGSHVLILKDFTDKGVYETRFYVNNNNIVEEYSRAEQPRSPEKGVVIGPSKEFSVVLDDSLLVIETDYGSGVVALNSEQR